MADGRDIVLPRHSTGKERSPAIRILLGGKNGSECPRISVDDVGVELRDVEVAQQEAAQALADMAREAVSATTGEPAQHTAVEVWDDAGLVLQVKFSFEIKRTN
jgi:hypothetical protein